MKSSKQKRTQLSAQRSARRAEKARAAEAAQTQRMLRDGVPANPQNLAPFNSCGPPDFVQRGYYLDKPFTCETCGKRELWTAAQQKWWYEVAKGQVFSVAIHCRACRKSDQARRAAARRVHLDGLARKKTENPADQSQPPSIPRERPT